MRTLIVTADRQTTTSLKRALARIGLDITSAHDGAEAWEALRRDTDIGLAIIDSDTRVVNGIDLCRRLRQDDGLSGVYVLLLLRGARGRDVTAALAAGADDYLTLPLAPGALRTRVGVALRILSLQRRLGDRPRDHRASRPPLIPICSYCKQVHSDDDHWLAVDEYLSRHSDVRFTHHVCPSCYDAVVKAAVG